MFHIIFTSTDNYIPYAAVLITSIVNQARKADLISNKQTSNQATKDKFVFHIITDGLKKETRDSLNNFREQTSVIYPFDIQIHSMQGLEYEKLKNYGSKIIYFRLKMETFLPDSIKTCLYLDVDMLALSDIRALFYINLDNKLGAVVCDQGSKRHTLHSLKNDRPNIDLGEYYFNSGFLLINLKQWRKDKITEKCAELIKNYNPHTPDQDILNAVMPAEKTIRLPFSWNFVTNAFCYVICKDEETGKLPYTRKEFQSSLHNPKILHYSLKPWNSHRNFIDSKGDDIGQLWWNMASQTAVFAPSLLKQKRQLINCRETLLTPALGFEAWKRINNIINFISIPLLALSKEKDDNYITAVQTIPKHLYNISCFLGESILHARAHKKKAINLILKTWKISSNFKKYGSFNSKPIN